MTNTIYDIDLDRNPANFQPLTPLSFLERAAAVFPQRTAVVHGARTWTYGQFYARARRLDNVVLRVHAAEHGFRYQARSFRLVLEKGNRLCVLI